MQVTSLHGFIRTIFDIDGTQHPKRRISTTASEMIESMRPHIRNDLRRILPAFLPTKFLATHENALAAYREHLVTEIARSRCYERNKSGRPVLSATDFIAVLEHLQICNGEKSEIIQELKRKGLHDDDNAISDAIDLSTRIWLMINIRHPATSLQSGQTLVAEWQPNKELVTFLESTFPVSRWSPAVKDSRLHPSFNLPFMVDVCGLKFDWTDSLADHLRLDRCNRLVYLFPYKAFLVGHLEVKRQTGVPTLSRSGQKSTSEGLADFVSPYSEQFLEETIWTLNLLLPHWDREVNDLLKNRGHDLCSIGPYDGPPAPSLIVFQHWRERLSELHDVVFLSPPVSWSQLWKDRRNPQQFWTFWIALVILGLTVISTAASVVQAWASIASIQR